MQTGYDNVIMPLLLSLEFSEQGWLLTHHSSQQWNADLNLHSFNYKCVSLTIKPPLPHI